MRATPFVICFQMLLWTWLSACSQTVRFPIAAGYPGLGAYSKDHVDVFSIPSNQACLAKMKSLSAGIYGEKRFLINELSLYNAALVVPTHSGNFALAATYYGFVDYNETQFGLAYARGLTSKIEVGVQFDYYSVKASGYGNASTITWEAGAIVRLTDQLIAGVHTYNPVGGKLGKVQEEKLASLYSVGLGYEASDNVLLSAEVQKQEDQPVNVSAGLQYKFSHQFLARAGVITVNSSMFLGIGFEWKLLRLDVVASYHPQLGITPGLLLIFTSRQRK